MMSCADIRPLISLFLEKETGPLETLEARRHLDGCHSCRSRARRLSDVMRDCAALPKQESPVDIASSVMDRLRQMLASMTSRAEAAGRRAVLAARWGGLALVLGAALATLTRPESASRGAFDRSVDYLTALLNGGDAPGRSSDLAGGALLLALRIFGGGGVRSEMPAGTGLDPIMVAQVTATALLISLLLALPAAVLTAWFLRGRIRRRNSRRT